MTVEDAMLVRHIEAMNRYIELNATCETNNTIIWRKNLEVAKLSMLTESIVCIVGIVMKQKQKSLKVMLCSLTFLALEYNQ